MRRRPTGYSDGFACCKDCLHGTAPINLAGRWRCYRVFPSRAVGAKKTCPYSKWRKQNGPNPK